MKQYIRNFRASFTTVGVLFAIPFAVLSLTPSLLPRTWFFQGVLTGLSLIFGYAVGNVVGATYRFFELPEFAPAVKKQIKRVLLVVYTLMAVFMILSYSNWDNNVRRLVGLEESGGLKLIQVVVVTVLVAYIILVISRFVRAVIRQFIKLSDRIMPRRASRVVGIIVGTLVIVYVANGTVVRVVGSIANNAYATRDGTTDEGVVQPTLATRSGSPDSLAAWDSLGRQGRKFTGSGPTKEKIDEFSGGGAKDPIRVYVGLKTAETTEQRAELALEELKRTGAFERDVLVVATTTGTGWLDPGAVDTVEFVNNGDTAIVGLQYSYLPSAISLFVDQQITLDSAQLTLNTVHDYWRTLDPETRPEIYLFGLSLGAFGSQNSASSLRLVSDPIDGALWTGSPFFSDAWSEFTNNRDKGSPAWRPAVDDGRVVRFTGEENELYLPESEWGDVKYAYLQHATDPVVFFGPGLLFNSPEWLIPGERGPDVTDDMEWLPGVTFFQVAADLPVAGAVPAGHGHAYSPSSYINAWAAITEPDGWTEAKSNKLKEIFQFN